MSFVLADTSQPNFLATRDRWNLGRVGNTSFALVRQATCCLLLFYLKINTPQENFKKIINKA